MAPSSRGRPLAARPSGHSAQGADLRRGPSAGRVTDTRKRPKAPHEPVATPGLTSLDVISAGQFRIGGRPGSDRGPIPIRPAALRGSLLASPDRSDGPFGQVEQYGPGRRRRKALIHELRIRHGSEIHELPPNVDELWKIPW